MAVIPNGASFADAIEIVNTQANADKGVFKATVTFRMSVLPSGNLIDSLSETVANAFSAFLPIEGSVYPGRPFVTCRKVSCSMVEKGSYEYVAEYSDENSTEDKGTDENPLLDRPIIKPSAGIKTRAIHEDREGEGILNKAGDPIVQNIEDNTVGFKVSANVASLPFAVFGLRNTCNSAPITLTNGVTIDTNAARFILPDDYLSDAKVRNEVVYYVFSYIVDIDERDYHYGKPLNAGFRELVDGKLKKIVDASGSEVSQPAPLDDAGKKIAAPTPENVKFLTIKKYAEADYAWLPGVV